MLVQRDEWTGVERMLGDAPLLGWLVVWIGVVGLFFLTLFTVAWMGGYNGYGIGVQQPRSSTATEPGPTAVVPVPSPGPGRL